MSVTFHSVVKHPRRGGIFHFIVSFFFNVYASERIVKIDPKLLT